MDENTWTKKPPIIATARWLSLSKPLDQRFRVIGRKSWGSQIARRVRRSRDMIGQRFPRHAVRADRWLEGKGVHA